MRKRIFLTFSLFVVVFLSGFSVSANAAFVTLTGRIIDSTTGNGISGALVTASSPISCGSWTGASALTNGFGYYSMSVPNDCYFIISPSRKDYTFYPVFYSVTPLNVNEEFDFLGTHD
ncbi:MAG: hypothetical protein ABWZ66_09695 [Pyrinomonadaceae bacterium]